MIYLVPNADCVCLNINCTLSKNAKYIYHQNISSPLIFLATDCYPLVINLYEICHKFVNLDDDKKFKIAHEIEYPQLAGEQEKTETKSFELNNLSQNLSTTICNNACCCAGDIYVFLNFKQICCSAFHTFKFKNSEIAISLSENLTISVAGELLVEKQNCALRYSHFEIFNEFCLIYFLGKRNFIVVLKNKELFYADYYDKIELAENEFYFLTFLNDSLNHGKVCHISSNKSEKYLVYLDEFEMHLKPEFLPFVFLDCLLANNFKYCNALLTDGLKQNQPKEIANFFCEFDRFYPLNNLTFAVIKKDDVVGIYKFELEKDKIANIIEI